MALLIRFGYGPIGQEVRISSLRDGEGVLNLAGVASIGVGWQYADDRRMTRRSAIERSTARSLACSPPAPARTP